MNCKMKCDTKKQPIKDYQCEIAQDKYLCRRKAFKPKEKYDPDLAVDIEKALEATWSPEQISNTVTKGKV